MEPRGLNRDSKVLPCETPAPARDQASSRSGGAWMGLNQELRDPCTTRPTQGSPQGGGSQGRAKEVVLQELTEDGGHAVVPSEQLDSGLEQLCPGQAAVAAVGLGIATELPGHPYPLGPCRAWQHHAPKFTPSTTGPSTLIPVTHLH